MLNRYTIYPLHCCEILEYNCHIKILDPKLHPLKAYKLYIVYVDDKEGEFGDGNEAVLGGAHFNHGFVRAAVEVQVLDWDVKLDRVGTFLGLTL